MLDTFVTEAKKAKAEKKAAEVEKLREQQAAEKAKVDEARKQAEDKETERHRRMNDTAGREASRRKMMDVQELFREMQVLRINCIVLHTCKW